MLDDKTVVGSLFLDLFQQPAGVGEFAGQQLCLSLLKIGFGGLRKRFVIPRGGPLTNPEDRRAGHGFVEA